MGRGGGGRGGGGGGGGGGASKGGGGGGVAAPLDGRFGTIRASEVGAFTRDSEVQGVLYHRTTPAGRKALLQSGFDPGRNQSAVFATGLYTSTVDESYRGSGRVSFAINTRKVLTGTPEQIRAHENLAGGTSAGFSKQLRSQGYDAIVIKKSGKDWVVILNPAVVRIVRR